MAKSELAFPWFGAYDQTPCKNVTITGCYFGNSSTKSAIPWPRGVGSHSATVGVWHENIKIESCHFEGLGQWGIRVYNWRHVNITNRNTFSNNEGDINIRSISTSDVKDTIDLNGNVTGKSQDMGDISITKNIFNRIGTNNLITAMGESTGRIKGINISNNKGLNIYNYKTYIHMSNTDNVNLDIN